MPSKAPPNERLREIRLQFASRRGIANVAMAVDGTHVPYVPPIEKFRNEYKNYKEWMSILVVAFVNSFHFFVDVDVGYPGKSGDSLVLRDSRFLAKVNCDKAAWLGDDGVIAADSGASDRGQLLLNPIPNPKSEKDVWYNFCHSSTRFFVEETFGRWKNRFRFLLWPCDIEPLRFSRMVFASCVLHNVCTYHADPPLQEAPSTDEDWLQHFKDHRQLACPSCVRNMTLHCVHSERNRASRPEPLGTNGANDIRIAIRDQLWRERVLSLAPRAAGDSTSTCHGNKCT